MNFFKQSLIISFIGYLIIGKLALADKISENLPPEGKETQVYMGDRMVEQLSGKFTYCFVPKFNYEKSGPNGYTYIIKKDIPLCEEKLDTKEYVPPYKNALGGSSGDMVYYAVFKEKGGVKQLCFPTWISNAFCKDNLNKDDYYFTQKLVETEKNSFQRVIEYAGKKGSVVKFIYSEFKDNMLRGTFTREFEVDLNDGKIVAYKGCIFEVIKVDNATITYKVIRHFKN